MKPSKKQQLAFRLTVLALASFIAGCSAGTSPGGTGNPPVTSPKTDTVTCSRGVASANGCQNKAKCESQSDCLAGFTCGADNKCVLNPTCTGENDNSSCGAGTCKKVADGKFACENPEVCDPDATTPWQCVPGFYCDSADNVCKKLPSGVKCDSATDQNGCGTGEFCTVTGCQPSGGCADDNDCPGGASGEQICTTQGRCVSTEGDKACGGVCNDSSNPSYEGGICNRKTGKCINITQCPYLQEDKVNLNYCQCGNSLIAPTEKKCGLGKEDQFCLKGYHWNGTKCEQNSCTADNDCTQSYGGGKCNPNTKKCEEPTPCEADAECSGKLATESSDSGDKRICASYPDHKAKACIWRDKVTRDKCLGNGYDEGKLRDNHKIVCNVPKDGCKNHLLCEDDKYCSSAQQCDAIPNSPTCSANNAETDSSAGVLSNLFVGVSQRKVESTVCQDGKYYYQIDNTWFAGKNLKVTVKLADASLGAVSDVKAVLKINGVKISEKANATSVSDATKGEWTFTFNTSSATDNAILELDVTGQGKRITVGATFGVIVEGVDEAIIDACHAATKIEPGADGSKKLDGTLGSKPASGGYDSESRVSCAKGKNFQAESKLYTFTLSEPKHVSIAVKGKGTAELQPSLLIRKGDCASVTEETSSCEYASHKGETASFSDLLYPGTYTAIVTSEDSVTTSLDYEMLYEEETPKCMPSDVSCSGNEYKTCNTKENKVETKKCSQGCSTEQQNVCKDKLGNRCESARLLDFSQQSGERSVSIDLSKLDKETPNQNITSVTCGATTLDGDKVDGLNYFFEVKVPPKSVLSVSAFRNLFSKAWQAAYAEYSLYILEDCLKPSSCAAGKSVHELASGSSIDLLYTNNENVSKSVFVVFDGTREFSGQKLAELDNVYRMTLKFEVTGLGECTPGQDTPKCVLNREILECKNNGKWEHHKSCSPALGCASTTNGDDCASPENEVCATVTSGSKTITALNLTNTNKGYSEQAFNYNSVKGEASWGGSKDCKNGGTPNNSDYKLLYYEVDGPANEDGKARVVVTPKNNQDLRLWLLDETACKSSSTGISSCESTNTYTEQASTKDASIVMEFPVTKGTKYFVAVGEKATALYVDDVTFDIKGEVVANSDPDQKLCDPLKFTQTCNSGKLTYCSDIGIKTTIECDCSGFASGETPFCLDIGKTRDDFTNSSTTTKGKFGLSCPTPRVLREKGGSGTDTGTVAGNAFSAYLGSAASGDENKGKNFQRYDKVEGVHGGCFFDTDLNGHDSVYAIYLKSGENLNAKFTFIGKRAKFRLFLLKDCGQIDTCYGLQVGSQTNKIDELNYHATAGGYVFVVVDGFDFNSYNEGEFELKWTVSGSGLTCVPDQTVCDATSNKLKICNNVGDSDTTAQCDSGATCKEWAPLCAPGLSTSSGACNAPLNILASSVTEETIFIDPNNAPVDSADFESPTCFGSSNEKAKGAKATVVSVTLGSHEKLNVTGFSASDKVTPVAWVASDCKTAPMYCDNATVPDSSTLFRGKSSTFKSEYLNTTNSSETIKIVLTSYEKNTENSPLYFKFKKTPPECSTVGEVLCKDDASGMGVVSRCQSDYSLKKIYDCGSSVKCDSSKPICDGAKKGDSIYNPISLTGKITDQTEMVNLAGFKRTVEKQTSGGTPVAGLCAWGTNANEGNDVYYKIHLDEKDTLEVELGDNSSSVEDYSLAIGEANAQKAFDCLLNDMSQGYNAKKQKLLFVAPNAGDYHIVVSSKNSTSLSQTTLTYKVTPSSTTCAPFTAACKDVSTLLSCDSSGHYVETKCPYGCGYSACRPDPADSLASICSATESLERSFKVTLTGNEGPFTVPGLGVFDNSKCKDDSIHSNLYNSDKLTATKLGYKVHLKNNQILTVYAKSSSASTSYRVAAYLLNSCTSSLPSSYSTSDCHMGAIGKYSADYARNSELFFGQYHKILKYQSNSDADYYLGFAAKKEGVAGTFYVDISDPCTTPSSDTCDPLSGMVRYCDATSGVVENRVCTDMATVSSCDVFTNSCIPMTINKLPYDHTVIMPPDKENHHGATSVTSCGSSGSVPSMPAGELVYKVVPTLGKELKVSLYENSNNFPVSAVISTSEDYTASGACLAYGESTGGNPADVKYTPTDATPLYIIIDSQDPAIAGKKVTLEISQ